MKAGFWEILLIVILVLVLFGHSKIPDLMKNLASGINVFKKELKTTSDKDNEEMSANKKATADKKKLGAPAKAKKPAVKAKTVKAKPVAKKATKAVAKIK